MSNKTCPVCGHSQNQTIQDCERCAWDFPVVLGDDVAVALALTERLKKAKQLWQANRFNPEYEPGLQRDPFETWDEFGIRIASKYWCAGHVMLEKHMYNLELSRFDIKLVLKLWATTVFSRRGSAWLSLNRESAKELFEKGPVWPVYFSLEVVGQDVELKRVILFAGEKEVEVLTSHHRVNSRYIDHRDGTVTDKDTGLMWMKPCIGQQWQNGEVIGEAKAFGWYDACKQNGEAFAGYHDWRLPTIEELNTLVYCSSGKREAIDGGECGGRCLEDFQIPAIDLDAFPNPPHPHFPNITAFQLWSCSEWFEDISFAMVVGYMNGWVHATPKGYSVYGVRLVRCGH